LLNLFKPFSARSNKCPFSFMFVCCLICTVIQPILLFHNRVNHHIFREKIGDFSYFFSFFAKSVLKIFANFIVNKFPVAAVTILLSCFIPMFVNYLIHFIFYFTVRQNGVVKFLVREYTSPFHRVSHLVTLKVPSLWKSWYFIISSILLFSYH